MGKGLAVNAPRCLLDSDAVWRFGSLQYTAIYYLVWCVARLTWMPSGFHQHHLRLKTPALSSYDMFTLRAPSSKPA